MPMRGILVAVACAVGMGGCYGSTDLLGQTDASADVLGDHVTPGTCGNGIVEGGEECDDGDDDECNGCTSTCNWERAMMMPGGIQGATVPEERVPCLPTPFTIEAWFRILALDMSCTIFYQPDCYTYSVFNDWTESYTAHEFCMSRDDGGCSGGMRRLEGGYSPDGWNHVAVTYAPNPAEPHVYMLKEYLNGVWLEGGWGTSQAEAFRCDGPLYIGAGIEGGSCMIDEVRISSEAVYVSDFTPPHRLTVRPDTVALWDFDVGSGTAVTDVSGNGHDAALVDGTLVPDDCHLP